MGASLSSVQCSPFFCVLLLIVMSVQCINVNNNNDESENEKENYNFILLLTDQERYPTHYDLKNEKLVSYREKMRGREYLSSHGVEFRHHYICSSACRPSRACLYTGQLSDLTNIKQTDALAKPHNHPQVQYLKPKTVPTIGDFVRAKGYKSSYVGKWHLSNEDYYADADADADVDAEHDQFPTPIRDIDSASRNEQVDEAYKQQDKLNKFGFSNWVGPEPHGPDFVNSGTWRDPDFVTDALRVLRSHAASSSSSSSSSSPFFLAINLVNPHDICLSSLWASFGQSYDNATQDDIHSDIVPPIQPAPTLYEDLLTKPTTQQQYRDQMRYFLPRTTPSTEAMRYHDSVIPFLDDGGYSRFYHYLHRVVDDHINTIIKELHALKLINNTIIIRTSDHGEMLLAHGGMTQKFHVAYEEVTHVPFVVSNPRLFPVGVASSELTSHLDILPTIIGLIDRLSPAGSSIDDSAKDEDDGSLISSLSASLKLTHSEVHPLPGRDLSAFIIESSNEAREKQSNKENLAHEEKDNTATIATLLPASSSPSSSSSSSSCTAPCCSMVYFSSSDAPFDGSDSVMAIAKFLPSFVRTYFPSLVEVDGVVNSPTSLEMIVVKRSQCCKENINVNDTKIDEVCRPSLHKLTRYSDDPGDWNHPNIYHEYKIKQTNSPYGKRGDVIRRTTPLESEYELYDLLSDPIESINLWHTGPEAPLRDTMLSLLYDARARFRQLPYSPHADADADAHARPHECCPPTTVPFSRWGKYLRYAVYITVTVTALTIVAVTICVWRAACPAKRHFDVKKTKTQ